jgi:SAM-dependent methyltransferase
MTTDANVPLASAPGAAADAIVLPPPGAQAVPRYDRGWLTGGATPAPFLSFVDDDPSVNWSEGLEALHEEASRDHFIDRWTRGAVLERIALPSAPVTIADVGCSTGYLLEDLEQAYPSASLVGVDLVSAGLRKAHQTVPAARLLHADACVLPILDASVDAVVSVNLLEHIAEDRAALAEIARVLKPGSFAVMVVPAGPRTYDYYDRFLGHERRYARGELPAKCAEVGLEPQDELHLAGLLYPAFWLVKHYNRARFDALRGDALEERVARDIARTRDSRVGHLARRSEQRFARLGLRLPFGIRSLVLARRPVAR